MKPISELNTKNIKGIFFDIDDTFSTDGKITKEAYSALWDLKDAGLFVIPITGRPAGWCDHIARMWPVTAVVGENGAFYFMMRDGCLDKKYLMSLEKVQESKDRLRKIKNSILNRYPQAKLSSDQNYREFDLAIDYCEDVKPLCSEDVDGIVKIFEEYGAVTKVSSIHVNGWFGDYDKLSAAKCFAKQELNIDLDKDNSSFVFVGDSPNDEPMFNFFDNSIGVKNVLNFKDRLKIEPKYITNKSAGNGFVEITNYLMGVVENS